MTVLVTHPGRQHSHQAAVALHRHSFLAGYWSGAPTLARHGGMPLSGLLGKLHSYGPVNLPAHKVRWHPLTPALRRAGDALLPRTVAAWVDYAACREFDRWVARRMRAISPAAVLGCEISAATTFRLARRAGRLTLLDAPSLHHTAQDRLHGTTDPPSLHRRIVATKDAEIATADHIVTVSPIARQTYVDAGVAEDRVHSVLLGADLGLFTPPREERSAEGPFQLVFAGARIRRKAFDLLMRAFEEVYRHQPETRLVLAGPGGDAESALPRVGHPGIEILGSVDQQELAEVFRRSHCLVLPSRNDSYGMVVAEALASGLPVVVSEMVGSKELVRPEETGWILPVDDLEALTRRLRSCVDQRARLVEMGPACRAMAETASWHAYHQRFAELVRELLKAHRRDARRRGSPPS